MKVVRCIVVIAILVGCFYSLSAGSRLQELKRENRELRAQTGDLQIDDPGRVNIVALHHDTLDVGVDKGIVRLWKFRTYYPGGYQPNHFVRSREVSADSPRAGSSGSSSYNNMPLKEAKYDTLTLSITKSEYGWRLSRLSDNASGATSVSKELDFGDAENLVIEPVVSPGEGTVSFPPDEPICILRVREKVPVKQRRKTESDEPLYRGFYYYLVPFEARESFEMQIRGEAGP
jgi:hypothetical protein